MATSSVLTYPTTVYSNVVVKMEDSFSVTKHVEKIYRGVITNETSELKAQVELFNERGQNFNLRLLEDYYPYEHGGHALGDFVTLDVAMEVYGDNNVKLHEEKHFLMTEENLEKDPRFVEPYSLIKYNAIPRQKLIAQSGDLIKEFELNLFLKLMKGDAKESQEVELHFNAGLHSFRRAMEDLRQNPTDADATVYCQTDQTFPVHRVVLMANSEAFRGMFRSSCIEKLTGKIVVEDVSGEAMHVAIQNMYTHDGQGLDENIYRTLEILCFGHSHQISSLVDACKTSLIRMPLARFTVESALGLYEVAKRLELKDLVEKCVGVVITLDDDITEAEAFKVFMQTHPELCCTLVENIRRVAKSKYRAGFRY